jgi:hypothetical protein
MEAHEAEPRRGAGRKAPWIAGAVVALAAVGAIAVVTADGDAPGRAPRGAPTPEPSPPRIRQAAWRIRTFPAGAPARMTRNDRRNLARQRPRVARLVKDVYAALFLERKSRRTMLRKRFARSAGRSLRGRAVGVPRGATRVKTFRRRARIGIDAPGVRRAVATVAVRARGRVGDRRFRVAHAATLWLQRRGSGWSVIAFDLRQRRLA